MELMYWLRVESEVNAAREDEETLHVLQIKEQLIEPGLMQAG